MMAHPQTFTMRSVIFCLLVASVASQAIIKSGRVIKPILRGVQPWEDATLEVPDAWDWTNVSGVNLVPEVRDQHAPATDASAYCGKSHTGLEASVDFSLTLHQEAAGLYRPLTR
jgi:hypothetical protein